MGYKKKVEQRDQKIFLNQQLNPSTICYDFVTGRILLKYQKDDIGTTTFGKMTLRNTWPRKRKN